MARTLVGTGALLLAVFAAVPDVGIGQPTSSSSSMPRTPWGDPDIQGLFTTDDELGRAVRAAGSVRHARDGHRGGVQRP